MIIRKYGITLVRLKKEHIEMVRQKRNLTYIQDKMLYQKKISWRQQRRWFNQINNKNNFYFLIQYDNKFIGLINGKDIDFDKRTCEGGIFIWEKEYWQTYVPVAASLILNDYNFLMADFKANYAKVLKTNKNAIHYNLNQGYLELQELENDMLWMELTKENYLAKRPKIKKAISIITKDDEDISVKDFSFEDDTKKDMDRLYTGLPKNLQELVTKIKKG